MSSDFEGSQGLINQPQGPVSQQFGDHYEVKDSRGTVIGSDNTIYQTFLSDHHAPLAHKLITFTTLIEEKTKGFVGRQFVFDALNEFTQQTASGYFIIKGEPGIGKSALIARLVKTRGYIHHFVVSTQGINRADQFLENVCAQLIAYFNLDRPAWLPPDAARDSAFFSTLLQEVSQKLDEDERAVILVDALDEADWRRGARENVLYLPPTLPKGVFIVVTMRYKEDLPLHVEQPRVFYLESDSPNNQKDVLAYITQSAQHEKMQVRLAAWGVTVETFAQALWAKSEGNFMYLHYVLPAIESGEFAEGTLDELPQGLKNYYERHWQQMHAIDEDAWVKFRQPVVCFLAAAREPVSVWQIASWAKLEPARVLAAIRDWREFLDEETVEQEKRYRIYHASFQDFLADKDEAKEINLKQTHSDIADELLRQFAAMKSGTSAPPAPVPEMDHVHGLQQLQLLIEQHAPTLKDDFLTLEARLLDNLNEEAKYGSTETLRADRARIVDSLNKLAEKAGLEPSFNDLCRK
jgi:hypothetical protein